MTRQSVKVGVVALLLFCSFPLLAQKTAQKRASQPQAIRFQGAPQYTQQELLAAAGVKPGTRLTSAEVKARAKQLNDTGLFKEVRFSSSSKGLLFTLAPSSELYPMHIENVPVTPGRELDAKLHERFPLYRNQLPPGGSMVDGICRMFEEMLAAKGAKATVKATLTGDLGPQKITAMNFSVVAPPVKIGRIQLAGVSPAMQAKASLAASGQTGNGFDTEHTTAGLKRAFEDLYQDEGYAAVQVDVAQADALAVSDQAIDVPYTVTIKEGGIYKVGSIDYPANAPIPRAEVEKKLPKSKSNSARPLDLYLVAAHDAYNAHGYLDCSIDPHASFNEATHVVNYKLEITPGPQYRFGSVTFEGAPDAMAAKLKVAWKMAQGDVFDQSYLSNFAALAQKKDKTLAKWMQTLITTYDTKPDSATHQVNCIFHFAKAVETPQ